MGQRTDRSGKADEDKRKKENETKNLCGRQGIDHILLHLCLSGGSSDICALLGTGRHIPVHQSGCGQERYQAVYGKSNAGCIQTGAFFQEYMEQRVEQCGSGGTRNRDIGRTYGADCLSAVQG